MKQQIVKKFKGLQLTRNSFENEGYLEIAENIVINYDNIIQSRRGRGYLLEMPTGQILNNIFIYKDEVLAISQNKLYRVLSSVNATASTSSGSNTVTVTLTSHGMNNGYFIGNMYTTKRRMASYFATRQKSFGDFRSISNVTANTFDITADDNATTTESGFPVFFDYYREFTGLSFTVTAAGVGVSRATKANKNLYFTSDQRIMKCESLDQPLIESGIPSATDISGESLNTSPNKGKGFFNPDAQVAYRVTFSRRDKNENFVEGPPSPSAVFVNTSQTSTSNTFFTVSSDQFITVNSNPLSIIAGDVVYVVSSVGGGSEGLAGFVFNVSSATGTSFTINVTGFGVTGSPTSLKYGLRRNIRLRYTIPKGITTEYKVNIYRTTFSASQTATPFENYRLVEEVDITTFQLTALVGEYLDDTPQEIIVSNTNLYTNPSQDGPLQTNNKPPVSKDITTWKGITFYASTIEKPFLDLNVISPSSIPHNAVMNIPSAVNLIFIKHPTQLGNQVTTSNATGSGFVITISYSGHGFNVGDFVIIYETNGISPPITQPIIFPISSVSVSSFDVLVSFVVSGSGTARFQGLRNTSNQYFVKVVEPSSSLTLSQAIDETARNFCRAVNLHPTASIEAVYLFDPDSAPGKIRIINSQSFTITSPNVPNGFLPSGNVTGKPEINRQANLFWSKINQPEAVPLVNFAIVGDADKKILRIAALRDSLIILKEDGVFRVNGDTPQSLSIIPMDTTVFCKSADTVRVLNNSVFCLTNQGIVQISDTSVRIASRDIEPVISATFGYNLSEVSSSVSSETDRLYMCSTIKPNSVNQVSNVVRVYNYLTDTWTDFTSDTAILFNGEADSQDKIVGIPFNDRNFIVKERKDNNRIDYVEEDEAIFAKQGRFMNGTATSGSSDVVFDVVFENDFVVGDVVSISEAQTSLTSSFGSPNDILGIRVVSAVTDTTITVTSSNAAISNGSGEAVVSQNIREYFASASATIGSNVVTVTTTEPHNLQTGNIIVVEYILSALQTAFTLESNVTGSRVITLVNATQFTFNASAASSSNVTSSLSFSTNNKEKYLAVRTTTTPRVGDCILGDKTINQIIAVKDSVQANTYSLKFVFKNKDTSFDYNRLGTYIRNRIKFAPLNANNTALLKQSPEFQCSFRNSISCSGMTVNYSTDSKFSAKPVDWDNLQNDKQVFLGGWGQLDWGEFPWGAELSINRQFLTQPAVLLRTYVPIEAAIGTFIQVALEHKRAGESIDLQSIALLTKDSTERTSR